MNFLSLVEENNFGFLNIYLNLCTGKANYNNFEICCQKS